MGGNLNLLKWLIEVERCALQSKVNGPLSTTSGLTALAIAAKYGHLELMKYLTRERGCSVTEIKEVDILQRGLHVALQVGHLLCVLLVSQWCVY